MTDQGTQRSEHFGLVVYPQFEVLDAFGPTEILHCLGHPLICPGMNITLSIIGPTLDPVSTGPAKGDPSPVKSRIAQTIVPTHTFDNPPMDIDVLIVPGGFGSGPKAFFGGAWEPTCVERVIEFLREQYPTLKHLLSRWQIQNLAARAVLYFTMTDDASAVCSGAGLAARAGILDRQKATTNKQFWKAITDVGPKTHWVASAR